MHALFHRSRRLLEARGLLAILFGLGALLCPNLTLQALVILIGAFVLADGVLATVATVRYRAASNLWWVALLEGLFGIAVGLFALFWPAQMALALVLVIGLWSLATGVIEILVARALAREMGDATPLLPVGILSALLGAYLLAFPHQGGIVLTWLIGFYALASGLLLILLSRRLHGNGDARKRRAV